jgi:hypothetical protein
MLAELNWVMPSPFSDCFREDQGECRRALGVPGSLAPL